MSMFSIDSPPPSPIIRGGGSYAVSSPPSNSAAITLVDTDVTIQGPANDAHASTVLRASPSPTHASPTSSG